VKTLKLQFAAAVLALLLGSAAASAADACDRDCLEGFVDRYLDAVVDDQPDRVPLTAGVRFTEDGQQLPIGDGLWNTLRARGPYRLFVTDVPAGQVTFFGSIEEDNADAGKGTPALLALRLKVQERAIAEIEQLVIRDDKAAARVNGRTPDPLYLQAVPAAERMSRADLVATANKYFSGMQQNDGKGDYPFSDDCNRIENGMQTTNAPTPAGQARPDPKTSSNYSAQWSCLEQFQSGLLHFVSRIRDRHRRRGPGNLLRVCVLRPPRGRDAHLRDTRRPQRDRRARAALDLADRRAVPHREGPDPPDRGAAAARALRHELRLEHLVAGPVGRGARRDDGSGGARPA
jgi:hypothetical protein